MRSLLLTILAGACLLLPVACTNTGGRGALLPRPPKIKTVDARTAPFVAGKLESVYHKRHCPYASGINAPQGYASERDAEMTGHTACSFCAKLENDVPPPAEKPKAKALPRTPAGKESR